MSQGNAIIHQRKMTDTSAYHEDQIRVDRFMQAARTLWPGLHKYKASQLDDNDFPSHNEIIINKDGVLSFPKSDEA